MAKNQEPEIQTPTVAGLSPDTQALLMFFSQQLAETQKQNALILERLSAQQAENTAKLVDTLVNPKMSAKKLAELEMERAAMQEANIYKRLNEKYAQEGCDHLKGMNGDSMMAQAPTWQRHQYANGVWGAICKKCGKDVKDSVPEQRIEFLKARAPRAATSGAGQNYQQMRPENREAAIERSIPEYHERSLYRKHGHDKFVAVWGPPSEETLKYFSAKG
jgi:hypothetical protein